MALPPSFMTSRAVQGYKPQFLNTAPEMATPASSGSADLTNRLLQIMSGNLGGTLSGGEKLSALGALLKSVSRGSQTSPQQVLQSIQQQKMQQVQGALQIQELRKAAQRQAQAEQYRQELISAETDPRRKQFLQVADMDTINKIAADQFKGTEYAATPEERQAVSLGLKPGSDAFKAYITQGYSRDQFIQTPQGTARVPGLGLSYQDYKDPETGEMKRAIIIGGKAYTI